MKEIQKELWSIIKKASFGRLNSPSQQLLGQALTKQYDTYLKLGKNMNEPLFQKILLSDIKNEKLNIYNLLVNLSKLYYINKDFDTSIKIHIVLLNKLIEDKAEPKSLLVEFYNLSVKYYQAKNPKEALKILNGYKRILEDRELNKEDLQTAIKSYILYMSIKIDLKEDLRTLSEYGKKALSHIESYTMHAHSEELQELLIQVYSQLLAINIHNKDFKKSTYYSDKISYFIKNTQKRSGDDKHKSNKIESLLESMSSLSA